MMDPKIKADWIKNLRSGEFKQARGQLYDPDEGGYCCLGVLCRTLGSEFFFLSEDEETDWTGYTVTPWNGVELGVDNEMLTSEALAALGMVREDITVMDTLTAMNDGTTTSNVDEATGAIVPVVKIAPKSFAEIADWIEENL